MVIDILIFVQGQIMNAIYILTGTILLDTVNFSKSADRTRELDIKVVEQLENILKIPKTGLLEYRSKIFNDLSAARTDITSLTPIQILFKDMKKLGHIPISGMPILIEVHSHRPQYNIYKTQNFIFY